MKTYIVDSFTNRKFKGNPAGVCIVQSNIEDELMLSIAKELNFSETAFIFKKSQGKYPIRYFSPKIEIPLCGHATLAAAKVLFDSSSEEKIEFITIEKELLIVQKRGNMVEMEFPIYETVNATAPESLLAALGISDCSNVVFNQETKILLLELRSTEQIRNLQPDFEALYSSHDSINGVLVTAASEEDQFDFHSRYFWPWSGTNEDPVTGGTHTFLGKYWSERLGKTKLNSFQSSARTGFMQIELVTPEKILIRGNAILVFEGVLNI